MAFAIRVSRQAVTELKALRAFDQRRIMDAINQQLTHQPAATTRNRKPLEGAVPDFEHVPPVWELRCGTTRVFYDIDAAAETVTIRAIRRKEQGQTTEEVIHERDDA